MQQLHMYRKKWYKLRRNSAATFLATLKRIKMLLQCFQQAGWSLQFKQGKTTAPDAIILISQFTLLDQL